MVNVNIKRFNRYDEAMKYLSEIFNLSGHWEAVISWSNRTEFEERPYKLILLSPDESTIKRLRKIDKLEEGNAILPNNQ